MTVSIETSPLYGELIRGVGVQFLDVFNQAAVNYSMAIDSVYGQEGNKNTVLAKRLTTKDQIVHVIQKSGLNYPVIFAEGAAIPSDSRILGYKTSIAPQYSGSSVVVTMRAMKDRDYSRELDEFKDLAVSLQLGMDKTFFDMFNLAFTAQTSLPINIVGYGDGKPMASTLHPRKDGGSAQSNASATGLVLNGDNLETALVAVSRQLDDRGVQINSGSSNFILMVPPEGRKTALEIAGSYKKVNTANNNINIYEGIVTVVSSKWVGYTGNPGFTGTTQWFVIDPQYAKLMFLLREGLTTHTATDANTGNRTFYAYARWASFWSDWRWMWASKGDGLTYSS